MHQSTGVGMFQTGRGLGDVVGGRVETQGTDAVHQVLQVVTLDVLHHQIMDSPLVSQIVGPDDVRMVERGDGLPLEMEAGQIGRIGHAIFRQHFNGHQSLHEHVFGQIDVAHAAAAQMIEQLVIAEHEAAVSTFEQLVTLPGRQQLDANEELAAVGRIVQFAGRGFTLPLPDGGRQPVVFHQTAALDQSQKPVDRKLAHDKCRTNGPRRGAIGFDCPQTETCRVQ